MREPSVALKKCISGPLPGNGTLLIATEFQSGVKAAYLNCTLLP